MIEVPHYPLISAKTFLEMSFSDRKAELDNGIVRIIDGVTVGHATVQGNLLAFLHGRLRRSGYSVYSSGFPIRTHAISVRNPDLMIVPSREESEHDDDSCADDPLVVFELVSRGTSRTNLAAKLLEYKALQSADTIVVVDVVQERLTTIQRTGLRCWIETGHDKPADLLLPFLDVTIPHGEIFARH